MGVLINPASELGKELRKWEQHHTVYSQTEDGNSVPGNPYVYRPYPKMLYKARLGDNGKAVCVEPPPASYLYLTPQEYNRACDLVEIRNRACQKIVASEHDERQALDDGWRTSPQEALAHLEGLQRDIAQAAAEAAYAVSRMSDNAQREYREASEQTHAHVTDLKGTKRGRKPKIIAPGDRDGVTE